MYRGKKIVKLKVDQRKVQAAVEENDQIADLLADNFALSILKGQGAKPELKKDNSLTNRPLLIKKQSSRDDRRDEQLRLKRAPSTDSHLPDRVLRPPKPASRNQSIESPSPR